jgi:hypothetical protein
MTESEYMPEVRRVWAMRAKELGLKPKSKGYKDQLEAYLQGVVALATTLNVMSHERAQMISFFVCVGRADGLIMQEPTCSSV